MAQAKIRIPDLNMTGTPSSANFLRGDGSWDVPAGAGDMSKSVYDTDNSGVVDNAEGISIIGRNATGFTLYKGTIIYILLSTGNRPNLVKALASGESTSSGTFGVIQNDILNNADGYCTTLGYLDDLDTRDVAIHPFTTDILVDGDTIYLSPTTAGYITNIKPSAPNHLVYLGKVIRTSPTNGTIVYRISNGFELEELHNVAINGSLANNEVLTYETSSLLWKPKSISTILGYTPANQTSLANYLPLVGGTMTGNITFSDDGEGVFFNGGAALYKKTGTGLMVRLHTANTRLQAENNSSALLGTYAYTSEIGNWGALNYPTWVSGTPFVKMTAAGTFALDTTVYTTNVGTVTSVTAGNGLTQSGTSTVNPTIDVVSHAGSAGTIGTINIGADAIGVNLGTTSTTATAGNDARLSDARTPLAHNQAWSTITTTPTTLSGYGITDTPWTSYLPLTGGTMLNTTVVTNLNADLLDGKEYSFIKNKIESRFFWGGVNRVSESTLPLDPLFARVMSFDKTNGANSFSVGAGFVLTLAASDSNVEDAHTPNWGGAVSQLVFTEGQSKFFMRTGQNGGTVGTLWNPFVEVLTTGKFSTIATDIKMNGAQALGSLSTLARADHVHPTDTSREPTITAGTTAQYWRGDKSWQTFPTIPTVTPSALTKVDDTNVTLTLGGSPTTALLQATSITVGWTGTLADGRIASAATWNAKQNALGFTPENVANKATDFTTVNNTLYPSVQAVKTYADGLVAGLLDDRGSYNASVNTFPTTGGSGTAGAVLKGDFWYVSVAGTLGGVAVNIGDSFRALVDTPAQTAGNWSILEGNLGFVPYNSTNPNNYTANLGTVTSVATGSGLTGGTIISTGTISLATAYGDTVNPYASKTANTFLAAPNGAAGVPTFRAIVSADIPTLNQATTGQAGSVAQALTITTGNGLSGTVATYNGSAAVTISHLNTDGNLHVPATSTTNNGKFLMAGATAGALSWGIPTDTNTTYTFATGTTNGTFNVTPSGGGTTAVSIFGLGSAAYTASTAYAAASHNQAWSTITSTPTTLSGYGITDTPWTSYLPLAGGALTGPVTSTSTLTGTSSTGTAIAGTATSSGNGISGSSSSGMGVSASSSTGIAFNANSYSGVIARFGSNTGHENMKLFNNGNLLLNTLASSGANQADTGYRLYVGGTSYFTSSIFGSSFTTIANGSGKTLSISGATATSANQASIAVTNGNLHIDAAAGASGLYLNYYAGTGGITFGNGAGGGSGASVASTGTVTAVGFYASSDARLKDIISQDGDTIKFTWKDKKDDKVHIGYIAQEIQETYPDQVLEGDGGMLSVNYIEVLVAKIQELENRLKKLEK